MRELRPLIVVWPGSGIAVGVCPLTSIGMSGRHTRLIRIVVATPTSGRQGPAFMTQRVRIAHQAGNLIEDVSRKGHRNLGW